MRSYSRSEKENYDSLKTKWIELARKGEGGCCFGAGEISPGSFVMHISDAGGASMSCYSQVELTGYFDNAMEALSFLRWVQLPRVLDYDTCTDKHQPETADAYLLKYNVDERNLIDHVIGLIDRALIAGVVSTPQLERIQQEFNTAFSDTNPSIQILAWGTVLETLTSPYFAEADEDEQTPIALKKLLDSGRFDEGNRRHLTLARSFFQMHMSA